MVEGNGEQGGARVSPWGEAEGKGGLGGAWQQLRYLRGGFGFMRLGACVRF